MRRAADDALPDLGDTTSLVGSGLLDSVAVYNLVNELEDRFGIEILDEELDARNFETIAAMVELIEAKLAALSRSEVPAGL